MSGLSGANPLAGAVASGPETDGWEPPISLAVAVLPPFPADVLPGWLDRFVDGLSTALQVPRELVALLALGAISAAVGGKVEIHPKPGHREPVHLWLVVALGPGNRKSAAVRAVVAPIIVWEAEQSAAMREEIAEATSRLKIREGALQRAERQAAQEQKHHERLRLEADAYAIAREVTTVHLPVAPRILADDVTAERLATLLMEHEGRMAIISPEGDVFDLMGGRYSNNIPNISVYLKAHAGDMIKVDRQGRPPDFVADPALTMAIAPQPDVLRGLTSKPGFRGRGLLGRFLYSLPESPIGGRDTEAPPLDPAIAADYERHIRDLLTMPYDYIDGRKIAHALRPTEAAQTLWKTFDREIEPRLGPRGDLGPMVDWGSKLVGAVVRLAGILHMARHGSGADQAPLPPIDEETMRAALALARYFIPHARAAFAQMDSDLTREAATHILAWLERRDKDKGPEFKHSECWQALRRRFDKPEDLDAPLARLVDHGYIRPKADPDVVAIGAAPPATKGRPRSPLYQINPLPAPMPHLDTVDPAAEARAAESFSCTDNAILVYKAVHENDSRVHENTDETGLSDDEKHESTSENQHFNEKSSDGGILVDLMYTSSPSSADEPESVQERTIKSPEGDEGSDDDYII